MSKREREQDPEQEQEGRTYAFFTFYDQGSWGFNDLLRNRQQAESKVQWRTDWKGKSWGDLEEGQWKALSDDELVFRVPMHSSISKRQVTEDTCIKAKPVVKNVKQHKEEESDDGSSSESWETSQARAYLRYA